MIKVVTIAEEAFSVTLREHYLQNYVFKIFCYPPSPSSHSSLSLGRAFKVFAV